MKIVEPCIDSIFNINSSQEFEQKALEIFRFQAFNCKVYRDFVNLLSINPVEIKNVDQIPFLPISFFKTHSINCKSSFEKTFKSSGTGNQVRSNHPVFSLQVYEKSFVKGFNHFFENFEDYTFLALLPSYLEQGDSSLVYMTKFFIENSKQPKSQFYLNNFNELSKTIDELESTNSKYIVLGVSYALLDFMEKFPKKIKSGIVMETGGMKGRREELTKKELHNELEKGFGIKSIQSEYGMTELLSQAYSLGRGTFNCPPWMRVLVRNVSDPRSILSSNSRGIINVIDLANVYSCSFIATDDLGRLYDDGSFEVLGRFDSAEARGCNLMVN